MDSRCGGFVELFARHRAAPTNRPSFVPTLRRQKLFARPAKARRGPPIRVRAGPVIPLEPRLNQVQVVFRVIGREFDGTFQPFARLGGCQCSRASPGPRKEGSPRSAPDRRKSKCSSSSAAVLNSRSISWTSCRRPWRAPRHGQAGQGSWPDNNGRRGIGLAREKLAAGGDALLGNRSPFSVVRGEVREIKARTGKLPCGGGNVGVRLKLCLRAVEFRLGAPGEDLVPRFAGENIPDGGGRKIAAASLPGRPGFRINNCHLRN